MRPLQDDDPARVGAYTLHSRLGRGAMGTVYLGTSPGGRPVAVKVARAELADDPEFRERFRREVEMARAVGGFWTAAVVDADPEAAHPWLATEYVAGPTLQQAVSEHGPLPVPAVRRLSAGLAEALTAIHAAGLVHRDLKPSNVLLGADGPRVIDFGISQALERAKITATGAFLGTPGFLSPEQITGGHIGPESDVFALGAVLTYAATGTGPFGDGQSDALMYRAMYTEPTLDGLPPDLAEVIAACLDRDPGRRPAPGHLLARLGGIEPLAPGSTDWLPAPVQTLVDHYATELHNQTGAIPVSGPVSSPDSMTAGASPSSATASTGLTMPVATPLAGSRGSEAGTGPTYPPHTGQQDLRHSSGGSEYGPYVHYQEPWPPSTGLPPLGQPLDQPLAPPAAQQTRSYSVLGSEWPDPSAESASSAPPDRDVGAVQFRTVRWQALLLACCQVVVGLTLAAWADRAWWADRGVRLLALIFFVVFFAAATRQLMRVARPSFSLEVGPSGLVVRRGRQRWSLGWRSIARVRVVEHGARPWLVVWLADGSTPPRTLGTAAFRRYHGGLRLFPVAHEQGRRQRRREVRELRAALAWHAPRAFDPNP
ncbi:protein kinase domain-containing protein [Actinopolymorpha pittospori]|uniref:Serine/threonine protein kinase n=1 Tax=Actinopolymorpha pittospori TaxID=648752 RepID=A0A927MZW3_9ACTN|nr:serine/threonine protein kinase [Actinopolymorpha pittospori]